MLSATTRGRGHRLPLQVVRYHDSQMTLRPAASRLSCAVSASSSASSLSFASSSRQQRRHIHSSEKRTSTLSGFPIPDPPQPAMEPAARAPLAVLPLSMILRSLATTVVSSSPVLLPPSLRIMSLLAHTTSPLFNPDKNPILRFLLKKTFYAQFCAGENATEVRSTIARLKNIGFNGVILTYAREVVLTEQQVKSLNAGNSVEETPENIKAEIEPWTRGVLQTVELAQPGDFVGVKFTGAGSVALYRLAERLPPSPTLAAAIDSICKLAQERGVRLGIDAEQDSLQDGIDDWTIACSRKYNTDPAKATVYNTYQAYKKCAPEILSKHLALAQQEGFTLGVKLVRGAYLHTDPRHRLHDTKADTDECYDTMAASVLTRQWSANVTGAGEYPNAHLLLATHNADSVRRARAICEAGESKSDIACAQLQGMADEVSCELVEADQTRKATVGNASLLPVYKYLAWGTTGECMKYLLRRAEENKDAVQRTRSGRDAMWAELVRRCKATVGLA